MDKISGGLQGGTERRFQPQVAGASGSPDGDDDDHGDDGAAAGVESKAAAIVHVDADKQVPGRPGLEGRDGGQP
ncbi:hypothetical protein ABZY81_32990 [Streptomyces sp. NPDC006514]|uniref:hypothetical protein n=1 Tax=Streptomyces sp. NPDC006514 TaxID=3154308 RepID=UPI0033BFA80A